MSAFPTCAAGMAKGTPPPRRQVSRIIPAAHCPPGRFRMIIRVEPTLNIAKQAYDAERFIDPSADTVNPFIQGDFAAGVAGGSPKRASEPSEHFDAPPLATQYDTFPMNSQLSGRRRGLYAALLIVGIAGAGAWTILYATQPGVGLYSDSTYYLNLARGLLAGRGFTIIDISGHLDPVPRYPFIYPTLLALPGLFRLDLLTGARWLGAILFFVNITLLGAITYRRCGNSAGAAALAAYLGCASFDMLSYHSIALSDAPSLLFVLLAFMFMGSYLEKGTAGFLICSAAATGVAFATRYAAAAFVLAGFTAILLLERKDFARRFRDAVFFGAGGSLLMILWTVRNLRYQSGATGRHLSIHPVMNMAQFKEFLLGISVWASNGAREAFDVYVRAPIVALVILVVLAIAVRALIRGNGSGLRQALPLLYIFTYAVVLLLTSTFLQADLFLDSLRILLPVHALMIILAVSVGSDLYRNMQASWKRAAAAAASLALAACFLVWMVGWARDMHEDGQGYASTNYTDSEMLQTIRDLPKDAKFYSNLPWPIGIYTDRRWSLLPTRIDITTLGKNPKYAGEMEKFARTLRERDVYLAWYKQGDDWYKFPSMKDVQSAVPLRVVAETEEGTIYEASGR